MSSKLLEVLKDFECAGHALSEARRRLIAARLVYQREMARVADRIFKDPERNGFAFGEVVTYKKINILLQADEALTLAAGFVSDAKRTLVIRPRTHRY